MSATPKERLSFCATLLGQANLPLEMKPRPCCLGHRAPSPPGPSRTRGSSLTGRHPSGLWAQTHEASSARNTLLHLSGPQLPFSLCSVKVPLLLLQVAFRVPSSTHSGLETLQERSAFTSISAHITLRITVWESLGEGCLERGWLCLKLSFATYKLWPWPSRLTSLSLSLPLGDRRMILMLTSQNNCGG